LLFYKFFQEKIGNGISGIRFSVDLTLFPPSDGKGRYKEKSHCYVNRDVCGGEFIFFWRDDVSELIFHPHMQIGNTD